MKKFIINSFANNKKSALLYALSLCFALLTMFLSICTVMTFSLTTLCFSLVAFTFFAGLSFGKSGETVIKAFKVFSFLALLGVSLYGMISSLIILSHVFVTAVFFAMLAELVFTAVSILLLLSALGVVELKNFNVIIFIVGAVGALFFFISYILLLAQGFTASAFLSLLFDTAIYALFFVGLIFDRTNELKPE